MYLHIISWNCASWKKTVEHINVNHKPDAGAAPSSDGVKTGASISNVSRTGAATGLEVWLSQLLVDILCLQEVKIDSGKVESLATQIGARSDNYDMFFACPSGNGPGAAANSSGSSSSSSSSAQTSGGLNGVATLVRKGHTVRACSRILDNGGELDREGRCLMTDHGKFVVFNVYIPNAQGGARLLFKQRFQAALKGAMQKQRQLGKMVILLGDFNLHYRAQDVFIRSRLLHVDSLLRQELPHAISSALHATTSTATAAGAGAGAAAGNRFASESDKEKGTEESLPIAAIPSVVAMHSALRDAPPQFDPMLPYITALINHIREIWPGVYDSLQNSLTVSIDDVADPSKPPSSHHRIGRLRARQCSSSGTGGKGKDNVILRTEKFPRDASDEDITSALKRDFVMEGRYINADTGQFSQHLPASSPAGHRHPWVPVRSPGLMSVEDLYKACSLLGDAFVLPNIAATRRSQPAASASATNTNTNAFAADATIPAVAQVWNALSDRYGQPCAAECDVAWMTSLLKGDRSGTAEAAEAAEAAGAGSHTVRSPNNSSSSSSSNSSSSSSDHASTDTGMVDAFAAVRPYARSRYTCWTQYTNDRFRNEGARIDYTLVDRALWDACGCSGGELDGYVCDRNSGVRTQEEQAQEQEQDAGGGKASIKGVSGVGAGARGRDENNAAFLAAVNFGAFQQAPMEGGGLQKAAAWAYTSHLRLSLPTAQRSNAAAAAAVAAREQRRHTGIIYTPPEYSDHVAVSLLLKCSSSSSSSCASNGDPVGDIWTHGAQSAASVGRMTLSADADTKLTQPHAKQPTLSGFFRGGAAAAVVAAVAGGGDKIAAAAAANKAPPDATPTPASVPAPAPAGKDKDKGKVKGKLDFFFGGNAAASNNKKQKL